MLDCSRNAVMKPAAVKDYISVLKKMGYNCMFLYIEDTYEIEGEPYFGYMRGRYTDEELSDMVSFGDSIGVEIVPCIQTLAHLNGTLRWSKIPVDCNDILLVDDERTYEMIEHMFSSLSKSFTSRKIHVGMDEAIMLGRGRHLDIHGYEPIAPIMKRHLTRVMEIAKKYFDDILIWSDMYILAFNKGGYYLTEKANVPDDVKASLPEGAIPVYWDYYHDEEDIYDINFDAHKQLSKDTWFAGGVWTWGGFVPHNRFSVPAMEAGIKSAIKNKIKNSIMTIWGDNGAECSKYSALPGLYAVSEFAKGNFDMEKIKAGFKRHTGVSYDDFMLLDEANYVDGDSKHSYYCPPNPAKYMLYSDCFNGFLDSTVCGGESEKYAELAKKLFAVSKKTRRYGYLFKTAACLSDALALKFELGIRTREIYRSGDKTALNALIADYTELLKKLKAFYNALRDQWYRENHPSGFDVQDLRLGGLMQRIASCKDRLRAYADGRIEKIEELSEDVLPYPTRGEDITARPIYVNNFSLNATSNIFCD